MDYKKRFAYFATGWGTPIFPNAFGGYLGLYGFLYSTLMQVVKTALLHGETLNCSRFETQLLYRNQCIKRCILITLVKKWAFVTMQFVREMVELRRTLHRYLDLCDLTTL